MGVALVQVDRRMDRQRGRQTDRQLRWYNWTEGWIGREADRQTVALEQVDRRMDRQRDRQTENGQTDSCARTSGQEDG